MLDNTTEINMLASKIDALQNSVDKMRRKMFARLSELEGICQDLIECQEELRQKLEPQAWDYCSDGELFKLKAI